MLRSSLLSDSAYAHPSNQLFCWKDGLADLGKSVVGNVCVAAHAACASVGGGGEGGGGELGGTGGGEVGGGGGLS